MIPSGFDDALQFKNTRKLPLGSWRKWLAECFVIVELRHKFLCSWATLVGMSVAMLELQPETRLEFRQTAKRDFNRSQYRRFLVYFVAMVDALSGASREGIAQTYRGSMFRHFRDYVPFSVLEWPHSDAVENTSYILHRIQPHNVAYPISRESDNDFYTYLLYGYYAINGNKQIISKLYYEYTLNTLASAMNELFETDEHLRKSIQERAKKDEKNKHVR